jgi:hypothetical protein
VRTDTDIIHGRTLIGCVEKSADALQDGRLERRISSSDGCDILARDELCARFNAFPLSTCWIRPLLMMMHLALVARNVKGAILALSWGSMSCLGFCSQMSNPVIPSFVHVQIHALIMVSLYLQFNSIQVPAHSPYRGTTCIRISTIFNW